MSAKENIYTQVLMLLTVCCCWDYCVAIGFECKVDLCLGGCGGPRPPKDIYNREIKGFKLTKKLSL